AAELVQRVLTQSGPRSVRLRGETVPPERFSADERRRDENGGRQTAGPQLRDTARHRAAVCIIERDRDPRLRRAARPWAQDLVERNHLVGFDERVQLCPEFLHRQVEGAVACRLLALGDDVVVRQDNAPASANATSDGCDATAGQDRLQRCFQTLPDHHPALRSSDRPRCPGRSRLGAAASLAAEALCPAVWTSSRYWWTSALPITSQLYSSSAVRRPFSSSRRRSPASEYSRPIASAKPSGSSRIRMFSPSTASSPSQPMLVLTTAFPMAHAVVIFSRVPPPIRSGTTVQNASRTHGRTSST